MNRIIIYLIILIALGAGTFYVLHDDAQATLDPEETDFAVKTEDIYKIFMADKHNNTVTLKRISDAWTVNDKYPVMPGAMGTLLKTIRRIRIDKPVPEVEHNMVVKALAADATKVEIYGKDGALLKTYFVGDGTSDFMGTYMLLEHEGRLAERPYVVNIPGFNGFLSTRYFIDEALWRSRKIIDLRADQIKSIQIDYRDGGSFKLNIFDKDSFELSSPEGEAATALRKEAVQGYLEKFFNIHVETFSNEDPRKDSVLNTLAFATLSIVSLVRDDITITIYNMGINKRSKSQFDHSGRPLAYDRDRFYALVNKGHDFAVIQDYVFAKILRRFEDFVAKPL